MGLIKFPMLVEIWKSVTSIEKNLKNALNQIWNKQAEQHSDYVRYSGTILAVLEQILDELKKKQ